MELLPSPKSSGFWVSLRGVVTPPRAALVALGTLSLGALWIGWRSNQLWLMIGSFGIFALIAGIVAVRFAVKGPEVDRALPWMMYSQTRGGQAVHVGNMDPGMIQSLVEWVIAHRQPLPPPSGVVEGSAADPSAIVPIPPEEGERLKRLDMGEEPPPALPPD
jgi:hypothetical protein